MLTIWRQCWRSLRVYDKLVETQAYIPFTLARFGSVCKCSVNGTELCWTPPAWFHLILQCQHSSVPMRLCSVNTPTERHFEDEAMKNLPRIALNESVASWSANKKQQKWPVRQLHSLGVLILDLGGKFQWSLYQIAFSELLCLQEIPW